MKLVKIGKKFKILIWHMAYGIWWMKWLKDKARFCLSYNCSCTLYFLMKMKELKFKETSHFSLLESSIMAQQNRNQKRKGCKWWNGIDQNLWPVPLQV